jgi:hypothetical protein
MGTHDQFAAGTPEVDVASERPVLTVFRSRRERVCDGCGGAIAVGSDYFRIALGSFHRECLPEEGRQ